VTGNLQCRDVSVVFGGLAALNGVSLNVGAGSFTGLIGPNGSGKTTLLNVVTGVQRPTHAEIELDHRRIDHLTLHERARAGIARTFQTLRLFDTLDVIDNVTLGAHRLCERSAFESVFHTSAARRELRRQREVAEELLAVFGERLLPRLDQQIVTLSYANRRRVEIARALMMRPAILLLDEPAAGMNPAETEELAEQLRMLTAMVGCSVLLVEHKMDFIAALCSEVYVLDHGSCLAHGPPSSVQQDPMVAEAFFGIE